MCHQNEYDTWLETPHADAAGIEVINETGTYYYVAASAHRIYTESAFLARCRNCHVTGWDEEMETWPEKETDPGKFLGIQCEYCHGPYQAHSADNPAMILDYSAAVCDDCHNQPGDHALSRHSQTYEDLQTSDHARDSCLHCMTTQGFIGQEVTMETEGLVSLSCAACHDSHSIENHYQLRYEDADEVCAQCHVGSHHPQSEFYPDGPHDKADVECVQCHGAGERLWHGSTSAWFNHTFWIYNINYPYDQEEPMVCAQCHEIDWATEQLEVIETLTNDFGTNATEVVHAAEAAIEVANATTGVSSTKITEAAELAGKAYDIIHLVEADASGGLHNPEHTYALLGHASMLAGEAQTTALEAQADALGEDVSTFGARVSTLESSISSLESDKETLSGQVASLESQVTSLETEVEEAKAKAGSGATTNIGIGAIVGVIIGAVAVFFLKKN
ncbi:MAG: ammonia-forming cytochrome c nitrite reductase subunit c552 [Candidatus Bathyarchaeota archaeon]